MNKNVYIVFGFKKNIYLFLIKISSFLYYRGKKTIQKQYDYTIHKYICIKTITISLYILQKKYKYTYSRW